jgi:metal-responsive CopG/Arc/MetJ family transcriptional regulator
LKDVIPPPRILQRGFGKQEHRTRSELVREALRRYFSRGRDEQISHDPEQAIDLSEILDASHENKWVALAPDYSRVIGASETLNDLMHTVTDADAVFYRVLPRDVSFAPAHT